MIKCVNCESYNVCLKIKSKEYKVINECFKCGNIIHLFIDDYFKNYKDYYSAKNEKEIVSKLYNCLKHSKLYTSFCHNCKEKLCEECLISHDKTNHFIQNIKEIFDEKERDEINNCKNELENLKIMLKKIIDELNNKNEENKDKIRLLNSLLNIIFVKNIFFDLKIQDDNINVYDLLSLKYILNKHNKAEINLLIKTIQNGIFPSQIDINEYNKCIFYSFKSITKEKIINMNNHNWVNHIIQLKNGYILSSTWDTLYLFKINRAKNCLDLILTIRVNNGSINHMYEYKKNKILCCDNQMKILQLNEENTSYKILYVSDYARKIIPFIPFDNLNNDIESFNQFLLTATPNGVKAYFYLDNKDININTDLDHVENDINYLGEFSNGCDFSSIIQVKNKICGIYKDKNSYDSNHFSVWEINYDFNVKTFSKDKFNLLGEIKNIGAGIGRYSITNVKDEYALIGIMKNGYNYFSKSDAKDTGIKIVSLETIEIMQYLLTGDEIMTINSLKNGMILTGGVCGCNYNRNYFIRQYRYDENEKEIILVGSIKLHSDFINTIDEINDGVFMSCARDGNIYLVYN